MFGIETLGGNTQAAVLVGIVLFEAIVLYLGYGGLEKILGPSFKRVLEGHCAFVDVLLRRCSVSENGGADR
ncbi:hypothetical protein ACFR9U_11600 [Halorientalis brevis]|uniref:Uncharacterized protein n=1 Tax=Halorientalis brevis TaxID=1126241 RepID=A0ABD6CC69_9EURY|nr:hypothetical protein [Halorientalis brevis]